MKAYFVGINDAGSSISATNYCDIQHRRGSPSGTFTWSATESARQDVIPHDLTMDRFRMTIGTAPGVGKNWTFTVRKNGSDTALVVVISDSNTSGQDLTHSVSFTAGDLVSIQCVPSGTPSAMGVNAWNIRQDATNLFALTATDEGGLNNTSSIGPQGNQGDGSDATVKSPIPTSGVFKNLYVSLDTAPGVGTSRTFTVNKNGSATGITLTISGASTSSSDTTHTVSVVAGDEISIANTVSGAPAACIARYGLSFDPDTDGESFLSHQYGTSPSTLTTNYQMPMGSGDANGWSATETSRVIRIGQTTIKAFYATLGTAPGAGKSRALTVRKEIAATTATFTISDANTSSSVTGLSVAVADDDRLSLECVPSGTPAASTVRVGILLFVDPGTATTATSNLLLLGVG